MVIVMGHNEDKYDKPPTVNAKYAKTCNLNRVVYFVFSASDQAKNNESASKHLTQKQNSSIILIG
ncbi:MAG: hypothetical protein D6823_08445 [Chloroflexi bacterium]|nr:MAG: hypothetical protein D6823_08445 [Chloroflexota bacterium]